MPGQQRALFAIVYPGNIVDVAKQSDLSVEEVERKYLDVLARTERPPGTRVYILLDKPKTTEEKQ